jgi:hypothetical protein
MDAASQVNVANSVTACHELLDCKIRDMATVSEMEIVEILAQSTDGTDGIIRKISAFGEYKISQPWSNVNNLLDSTVC